MKRVVHRLLKHARLDARSWLLRQLPKNSVGAEVGVWKGDFSEEILRAVRPEKLYLVDPWAFQPEFSGRMFGGTVATSSGDMDKIFSSVERRFCDKRNVHLIRKFSVPASQEFEETSLDWVYVDANHEFESVLEDLQSWGPRIRAGGILAGDDYHWGPQHGEPVRRAVSMFVETYSRAMQVETRGSQFLVRLKDSV